MKKVVFVSLVSVFLSLAVVLGFVGPVVAGLPVHNIDTGLDYATIQEAINAPQTLDGHIILVDAGTYNEHVTIDKSISLIGEKRDATIIEGGGTLNVVHVTADNVTISGFTIQNSHKGDVGIWIDRCRNCTVSRNNVKNCGASNGVAGIGIELDYCDDCTVDENNINSNNGGIVLAFSHGCTVCGNSVDKNNKFTGIDITLCSDCAIIRNTVSNNKNLGIRVYGSHHCIFRDNNITNSNQNFGAYGYELSHFVNDVDVSNTINGKPIIYLVNECDLTVNPSTYPVIGYLAVVNSTNITVQNLTLTHNGEGVLFAYTNNSTIRNVSTSCNDYGIYLINCDNCMVNENTATNNVYGICLWYSHNCIVTGNIATNNEMSIRLYDCRNCTISGNKEQTVLLWMQWWFWAIVAAGIVVLAGAVYILKKRKPPTTTATPLPPEGTTYL